jgi:hypothetical protein
VHLLVEDFFGPYNAIHHHPQLPTFQQVSHNLMGVVAGGMILKIVTLEGIATCLQNHQDNLILIAPQPRTFSKIFHHQ